MKRHALTILAAVSLLVCVIALWNWAISFTETVRIGWTRGGLAIAGIEGSDDFLANFGNSSRRVLGVLREVASDSDGFLGFAHEAGNLNGAPYQLVVIPYWFIVTLTGILPVRWWLLRRRQRERVVTGRCLGCGYDLRGSSGRCPECGAWNGSRPSAAVT
jgi:hypothetical protein